MKQLLGDIGDHFEDRIADLVEDTLDTCHRMDLPYKASLAMVASVLGHKFATACVGLKLSEEVFLNLCKIVYERETKPRKRQAKTST